MRERGRGEGSGIAKTRDSSLFFQLNYTVSETKLSEVFSLDGEVTSVKLFKNSAGVTMGRAYRAPAPR
jgi:hypothetical protein